MIRRIPALYMTMLETAEIVSERYQVPRYKQDEYALQSQRRTADAQVAGRFNDGNQFAAVHARSGGARNKRATASICTAASPINT